MKELKEIVECVSVIIVGIFLIAGTFLLLSAIFYGLGLFGKFVFHSQMEWTFLHGMFFALVYWLLRGLVKRGKDE